MSQLTPPSAEEQRHPARIGRRSFLIAGGGSCAWVLISGLPFGPRGATSTGIEAVRLRLVGSTTGYSHRPSPLTVGPGWSTQVALPIPGQMITLGWQGSPEARLALRSHRREDGWSPWAEAEGHEDEGPDRPGPEPPAPPGVGPIWVGAGTEKIELRVLRGQLSALELETLRSTSSSQGWFGLRPALAAPAYPHVQPRSAWGAGPWISTNPDCKPQPIDPGRLRLAVVHHTVSTNTYRHSEARDLIRGIYHHHVNNNRWCDVAYNFFVDRFGTIYEGRTGSIQGPVVGAHATGFNTGSVGIALLGQHHPGASPAATAVSLEARAALRRLLAWLFGEYGIDAAARITFASLGNSRFPEGTPVPVSTVSAHRDVGVTACPGENTVPLLPVLRQEVQRDVALERPSKSRWAPQEEGPSLVVLDAYGGVHPAGTTPAAGTQSTYWRGWAIARGIVLGEGGAGWVLDAYGGLHPFGGAHPVSHSAYRRNQDAMRAIAPGPVPGSGYVLERTGDLHPFGAAPPVEVSGRWPASWNIAVAAASNSSGSGGYVLDAFGALHPWGDAPPARHVTGYWHGWRIARGLALRPDGTSGWVLDAYGGLHPFGGAPRVSAPWYTPGRDRFRTAIASADGSGGWVLDVDGQVHAFGGAPAVTHLMTFTGLGIAVALAASPTDRGAVA